MLSAVLVLIGMGLTAGIYLQGSAPNQRLEVDLPKASFIPSELSFKRFPIGPSPTQGQLYTNIAFSDIETRMETSTFWPVMRSREDVD